jgi:D-glycero-beta-D-manno-heptose-7-phosphate kinase
MSKIVVIGDSMLDEYIYGNTDRKNPESPMPLINVEKEETKLWWASNVAHNISSINKSVDLITMIGNDLNGKRFIDLCKDVNIKLIPLLSDSPTITKKRFLDSQYKQQLLRVDYENKTTITDQHVREIESILASSKPSYILISDYNKGIVKPELIDSLKNISKSQWTKILVDTKPQNINLFEWVYLIKPNFKEFCEIMAKKWMENTDKNIETFGKIFTKRYSTNLVVTRGDKWSSLITIDGNVQHIHPTQEHKVFDVTGAGDTFIATLAYALDKWYSLEESVRLANTASGIVVEKVGTATITKEELGI